MSLGELYRTFAVVKKIFSLKKKSGHMLNVIQKGVPRNRTPMYGPVCTRRSPPPPNLKPPFYLQHEPFKRTIPCPSLMSLSPPPHLSQPTRRLSPTRALPLLSVCSRRCCTCLPLQSTRRPPRTPSSPCTSPSSLSSALLPLHLTHLAHISPPPLTPHPPRSHQPSYFMTSILIMP